jgi:hypothetical protein
MANFDQACLAGLKLPVFAASEAKKPKRSKFYPLEMGEYKLPVSTSSGVKNGRKWQILIKLVWLD